MSENLFSIIFKGELHAGHDAQRVQDNLCQRFKLPREKVQRLFNGEPVVIKKGLTHAQALKYVEAFESAGAKVLLRSEKKTTVAKQQGQQNTELTTEQILQSFGGEVPPVRLSTGYKISISLAAFFILMIPVVYVCLILFTIYGVYYHATENLSLFNMGSKYGALIIYLTPIVAGSILVLFMVKPLFATFGRPPSKLELDPNIQPRIYAFVRRICDTVKAPYPSVIVIDSEVNASASFRSGVASFFSNELVLTIGLPLLRGLDLRTLTGILAHEFGHFSQGAAMRMTYIIYTVLYWLHVAVHNRDRLDEKLEKWGQSEQTIILVTIQASRLFIWLTRKLLSYMLKLGDFINYSMSRQMEFDADRYATRLIGSDNFQNISIHVTRLAVASDTVNEELNDAWYQHQVLVDDLSGAILSEYRGQPEDIEQRVMDYINEGKTHWQDTHPCDRERIENAKRENVDGVFQLTIPAASLINKIEKLSKELTFLHYRNVWGVPVSKNQLIPVEKFEGDKQAKQENYDALERFFGSAYTVYAPVSLDYPLEVVSEQQAQYMQEWQRVVTRQKDQVQIKQQYELMGRLYDRYGDAERAAALVTAGFNVDAKEFGLTSSEPDKLPVALEKLNSEYNQALADVLQYNSTVFQRMQLALTLSLIPEIDRQPLDQIATHERLKMIVNCLSRISPLLNEARQLHFNSTRLGVLLYNWKDDEQQNPKDLRATIEKTADICRRHIDVMQNGLARIPYPFEHAKQDYQLVDHIFGYDLKDMSPPQIEGYSEHVLANLHSLQWRMVSLLSRYAEQVERQAGLVTADGTSG